MINSLNKIANWNQKSGSLEDVLNDLEKDSNKYLDAKLAQNRKNPSALRNTRLEYGSFLKDFALKAQAELRGLKTVFECSNQIEAKKASILQNKQEVMERKSMQAQQTISKDVQRDMELKQPEIQSPGLR